MIDVKTLTDLYRGELPQESVKQKKGKDEFAQFVEARFVAMAYAKQPIREIWQGTQDLYYCNDLEWIVKGEGFERPVRFPTLRDFIKSLVDVFMKDPPEVLLNPLGDRTPEKENLIIGKRAYYNERMTSLHEKRVRRQVVEDMFFYGKGFRKYSYFNITKNYDKDEINLFNHVASQRLDPRHFFVDEMATVLHDETRVEGARDTIYRAIVSPSYFYMLCQINQDRWSNSGGIEPENYFSVYGLDYITTNSRETVEKTPLRVMKIYEYENIEQDIYALVVNGQTIYQNSLKKEKGVTCLSTADYTFEPRNDSYWGNNLALLIAPHIYLKDTIFNLELLNLKLTLQPVVAVSGDFGYDPASHLIQPGGVWQAGGKLNGKISDSISPVIFGNPNTKSWDMLQDVNSELSITTRTDLRTLEFYPNKTATETLRQNQAMNAHNETVESITEVESEGIGAKIFLQIMEEFMQEKDEKGDSRQVNIKDYVVTKKDDMPTFIKKAGAESSFLLTKSMIEAKAEVKVIDSRKAIAQNVEKLGRIMQALPLVGNMAQLDPGVLKKLDVAGLIQQLIENVGLDLERSFRDYDDLYDEFALTKEELLLGHHIDVPEDESRAESLARIKYFGAMLKNLKKDLSQTQVMAIQYHLDKAQENFLRNHLDRKRAEKNEYTANPEVEPNEQQTGAPQGIPPGMLQPQHMQQPDKGLLNIPTQNLNQMQ